MDLTDSFQEGAASISSRPVCSGPFQEGVNAWRPKPNVSAHKPIAERRVSACDSTLRAHKNGHEGVRRYARPPCKRIPQSRKRQRPDILCAPPGKNVRRTSIGPADGVIVVFPVAVVVTPSPHPP